MPIKTGCYFIINVRTKNQAFLPNSDSAEPIQSTYQQDDAGEQWNVIDRKNGHHTIMNARYKQYASSGTRAAVGEQVVGWERDQTWLIQKTRVKGQYTICTTDAKQFWGVVDTEPGAPIALANVYGDTRNWWIFKEVETGKDAEVDPALDNGRTAKDTARGDMILQAVFFELGPPPVSSPDPLNLDLVVIQEMHNEFIPSATETAGNICSPLINSGQLDSSNLRIKFIEFESFDKTSHQRFSGVQTFQQSQDYQGRDLRWIRCTGPVIPSSLTKGMKDFQSSTTKVVVLNVKYIPIRNGGQSLLKLLYQMAKENVILILTLSEPHLPDILFDTDLFRELAKLSSGSILSLPVDGGGFYSCIVDYLREFKAGSIKSKFPSVEIVDPEIPLSQRKHLMLDAFSEEADIDDSEEEEEDLADNDASEGRQ